MLLQMYLRLETNGQGTPGIAFGKTFVFELLTQVRNAARAGTELDEGAGKRPVRLSMSALKEISVEEVFNLFIESGSCHLVDVREEDEYSECSATNSSNVPLSILNVRNAADHIPYDKQELIYVICRSGRRSAAACQILSEAGFRSVYNVKGGMEAWKKSNLPIRC
jgi:rhodanese-related sulfurtransferase